MKGAFIFAAAVLLTCSFSFGQAQYKVLWNFGSIPNDGFSPVANLVFDSGGNLYGTTESGGANTTEIGGTVFELSPQPDGTWTETVLYNFCSVVGLNGCLDGGAPEAGLIFDAKGNIYGTTAGGGANFCPLGYPGCGTVFELSPGANGWTETVLYSFCAVPGGMQRCLDGAGPRSQFVFDGAGNLYGTTALGGSGVGYGGGTVFELSPDVGGWEEAVLYSFCSTGAGYDCEDGSTPLAGVTFDKAGNLYGTTAYNGKIFRPSGAIYRLKRQTDSWTESLLFAMQGRSKDNYPEGSVVFDPLGNLYTTFGGGGTDNGGGVIRLSPQGRSYSSSLPYDGGGPAAGPILDVGRRLLYGTASGEGCCGGFVFQLNQSGKETTLYDFCQQPNCSDGAEPLGSLIEDRAGNLYGTTKSGGEYGYGVVFEITP